MEKFQAGQGGTARKLWQVVKTLYLRPRDGLDLFARFRLDAMREAVAKAYALPAGDMLFDSTLEEMPTERASMSRRLFWNRLGLHASAIFNNEARNAENPAMLKTLGLFGVGVGGMAFGQSLPFGIGYAAAVFAGVLLAAGGWRRLLAGLAFNAKRLETILPLADLIDDEARAESADFAARCLFRLQRTNAAPADLADRFRTLNYDENGESIDGQVINADVSESYLLNELQSLSLKNLFAGLLAAVGGAGFVLAGFATLAGSPAMLGGLLAFAAGGGLVTVLVALWGMSLAAGMLPDQTEKRAEQAIAARDESPVQRMIEQVGVSVLREAEKARISQVRNVIADASPFLQIGQSTGLLAQRRDPFAPSEPGMPFGLSVNDLSMHLILLGATGSGKTVFLRAMLNEWRKAKTGGLVILDGKGALPAELAGYPGFVVINPDTADFNPIFGLTADEVADTLFGLFGNPAGENAFFDFGALKLVRSAAAMVEYLSQKTDLDGNARLGWNLENIYSVCAGTRQLEIDDNDRAEFESFQRVAWDYLAKEHPEMPEKARGSVEGVARQWLSVLVDNRHLGRWARVEKGVMIEEAFLGKSFGVLLPEAKYGQAGVAVSALAKARLYRAAKVRGDGWKKTQGQTPALLVVDECQALVTPNEDSGTAAIGRSLGLYLAFSTQSLDGLESKLGETETEMLLGNLRNMISLNVETEKTRAFVAKRMGSAPRTVYGSTQAARIDGEASIYSSVSFGGGRLSQAARQSEYVKASRLYGGIGGHVAAGVKAMAEKTGADQVLEEVFSSLRPASQTTSVNVGIIDMIEASEIGSLTAVPNTALVSVVRGRVVRRDLVRLNALFAFPQIDQDGNETAKAMTIFERQTEALENPCVTPSQIGYASLPSLDLGNDEGEEIAVASTAQIDLMAQINQATQENQTEGAF